MKTNKNHTDGENNGSRTVPVQFEFTNSTAVAVSVAGTFNDWKPEANDLHRSVGGRWYEELSLKPGNYEYCLVVDGLWMPDPLAMETVLNPYGGRNSVLMVANLAAATHRAEAEKSPLKLTNKTPNQ